MDLISNLKWRYATKKFDPNKKVNAQDLDVLKTSIQLTATSHGLQLFKVLIIEDNDLKAKLRPASYDQSQISDASHIFVFCNYTKVTDEHIDEYMQLKAKIRKLDEKNLKVSAERLKQSVAKKEQNEGIPYWTEKQTYIALGTLLVACAELKIDSCPIAGFEPEKYNEILGLNNRNLNAAVVAAVGYRSPDDECQFAAKVRKSKEDLFETY